MDNNASTFAPGLISSDQFQSAIPTPPQPASPTPAQTQPAAKQPSWLEKLLPLGGGVLGGILGGVAAPLTGGIINPIDAAAALGAGGQMAENALSGKKVLQGNDVSAGAENALGEGLGLGAKKVVGALGEGLVNAGAKAGDKVAQQAVDEAASQGAVNDATATKLNFGGVSPKLANELELGKSQQFVKSMGSDPTNPYEMAKLSDGVSEMNNVYDRALQASPDVNMSDFNTSLFKALKAGGSTDLNTTPVGQALSDFNKTAGLDPNAEIGSSMPATQVRQLQQAVGRQIGNTQTVINNAELNGTYNTEAQSSLNTLQDMYKQLGDKIKTPAVNQAIQKFQVTDADRQGLIAKYGDKMGAHIADTIGNAKSADDLLGPMQDLTKMGRASRMAINDIENVTNSPRAEARAKFEANGGVAPSNTSKGGGGAGDVIAAAAKSTGHPASLIVSAANKAHQAGLTPKIAKGMGDVIRRTAPLLPTAAVVNSNIPNIAAESQPNGSVIPSNQGGNANVQPAAAAGPGFNSPVNSVLNSILTSLNAPGASLTPGYGSMVSGASALAQPAQANELAANAVSTLPSTYANAGGSQGLLGGLLSTGLSKVPGTAQNTYSNEQIAAADQLAKILGISPQAALAMLPQFTQTAGTAAPQQAANAGLVNSLTSGLPTQ